MTKRWLLMWYNGFEYERHTYFDHRADAMAWLAERGFHTVEQVDYPEHAKDQFFTKNEAGRMDSWAIVDTRLPPKRTPIRIIGDTAGLDIMLILGIVILMVILFSAGVIER